MGLRPIQDALCELYDLSVDADVEDYLCDAELVDALTGGSDRGEVLLVSEEADHVSLGLYVCPDAVRAIATGGDAWSDDRVQQVSLATEGVSHFVYVFLRADAGGRVSQLELELQAEVDKYASATVPDPVSALTGFGVGLIRERSRRARRTLFAGATFRDPPGSPEGQRYRAAHDRAATYAARLETAFLDSGDVEGFLRTLRRFYRSGLRQKLEQTT